MSKSDWYKLTFEIESNLEEIIFWKLNDLGIFSFSLEYSLKNKSKKEVNVWLPILTWDQSARNSLEISISKLLKKNTESDLFDWNIIAEEDWLTSWKKYWGPELVGNNLLILPCWINPHENFKDKKIIRIDPGAAFGTGSHPTTYLCLEKIEQIPLLSKKVLDVGSGSGILSIAAKSFGAKEILAIDNDYLAINSTQSNYELNFGNTCDLKTHLGSFDESYIKNLISKFDIVLCNILFEVISEIIPYMTKCLVCDGKIILSGILNSQKDQTIMILKHNHFKLIDISSKKDWVCITAQKVQNPTIA